MCNEFKMAFRIGTLGTTLLEIDEKKKQSVRNGLLFLGVKKIKSQ